MQTSAQCCDLKVRDIAEARRFYAQELGCTELFSNQDWLEFSLYGTRVRCHRDPQLGERDKVAWSFRFVDGACRLVPHCTVPMSLRGWNGLASQLSVGSLASKKPKLSMLQPAFGEALYLVDPSGNVILFGLDRNVDKISSWKRLRTALTWVMGLSLLLILLAWLVPPERVSVPSDNAYVPKRLFP